MRYMEAWLVHRPYNIFQTRWFSIKLIRTWKGVVDKPYDNIINCLAPIRTKTDWKK